MALTVVYYNRSKGNGQNRKEEWQMVRFIDRTGRRQYDVTIIKHGCDITRDCVNEMDKVLGYDCEIDTCLEYLKEFYDAKVKELYPW